MTRGCSSSGGHPDGSRLVGMPSVVASANVSTSSRLNSTSGSASTDCAATAPRRCGGMGSPRLACFLAALACRLSTMAALAFFFFSVGSSSSSFNSASCNSLNSFFLMVSCSFSSSSKRSMNISGGHVSSRASSSRWRIMPTISACEDACEEVSTSTSFFSASLPVMMSVILELTLQRTTVRPTSRKTMRSLAADTMAPDAIW
mmetsp:Transcript_3225/g.10054  ORF Transcript_3225/g.10054 Transcript_3225/m.10054 type:complete len:203 (-) Transcript_3225:2315-2923(-)